MMGCSSTSSTVSGMALRLCEVASKVTVCLLPQVDAAMILEGIVPQIVVASMAVPAQRYGRQVAPASTA